MNKLTEKIITIIKQKSIRPRPKWFFYLQNIIIWLALFVWIVLGGLAGAMIIDNIRFNDWSLALRLDSRLLIKLIPFFWLIIFIGATLAAKLHFKKTKHGYRYPWTKIIIIGLIISSILALILITVGWSQIIDNRLAQQPIYRQINCQDKLWFQPNNGLLLGTIKTTNGQEILLIAPDNSTWLVKLNNETKLQSADLVKNDQRVKILGKLIGKKIFQAKEIRLHAASCGCGHCQCH